MSDKTAAGALDRALLSVMHVGAMLDRAMAATDKSLPVYQMLQADAEGLALAIEILKEIQGTGKEVIS